MRTAAVEEEVHHMPVAKAVRTAFVVAAAAAEEEKVVQHTAALEHTAAAEEGEVHYTAAEEKEEVHRIHPAAAVSRMDQTELAAPA